MTTETAKQHDCQTFNNKVAYTYLLHNIFIDIQREREKESERLMKPYWVLGCES